MLNVVNNQVYDRKITKKTNFGSRKIPKNLYHLTSISNWNKIQQTKQLLNHSEDILINNGVFMVDLNNLFKNWSTFSLRNGLKLINCLIINSQKDTTNLVLLKIPTDKLNRNQLFIRPQEMYFKLVHDVQFDKWLKDWRLTKKAANNIFLTMAQGIKAQNAKKYTNKFAIEYIYKESIPVDAIEKVGNASTFGLRLTKNNSMLKIWGDFLKGNKEEKALIKLTSKLISESD